MTVIEAARRLEVSPSVVRRLCAAYAATGRGIPHRRVGTGRGVIRITEQDLDRYLEAAEVKPPEAPARKPRARAKEYPMHPAWGES